MQDFLGRLDENVNVHGIYLGHSNRDMLLPDRSGRKSKVVLSQGESDEINAFGYPAFILPGDRITDVMSSCVKKAR